MDNAKPEDKLIEQRKEKLISFLKADYWFSAFIIIAIISIFFSVYVKSGAGFIFSAKTWFALFIFSSISAAFAYFKKRKYVFYPILAWIVWVAVEIRTLNLPYLRDITTGSWTLGPDLDPFLFLRWAKYIVTHGSLMAVDTMRYIPLGFETKNELIFLPYLIAWFHKAAVLFGSTSIEHSAVLFPTFMFSLAIISFFLFVRSIFKDSLGETYASLVSLLSSLFFAIFPVLLPRTISGIPEKESAAFFFLFASLYLFLYAWKSHNLKHQIPLAILSGLATAGMALVWGGVIFLFFTISFSVLVSFLIGQYSNKKLLVFSCWIIPCLIILNIFSLRYTFSNIISSLTTQVPLFVFGLLIFHFIFSNFVRKKIKFEKLEMIPENILSLILFIIFGAIISIILLGPSFVFSNIAEHLNLLTNPAPTDRFSVTVAENREPYFSEWVSSFGPFIQNIPITFWLFFFGTIALFYFSTRHFDKKERTYLLFAFAYFFSSIIFSRIEKTTPILNGSNLISKLFYFSGIFVLLICAGYFYYRDFKLKKENKFILFDFGIVIILIYAFFALVSVRGAIRLVMMLAPAVSISLSFLFVYFIKAAISSNKGSTKRIISIIIILIVGVALVFSASNLYHTSSAIGKGYAPSLYNQQWQKAMSWVRENTPENSVFAHWWDYGYWVQSIGERATILDGGNAITYWNHLMGRLVLTAQNDSDGLEFLFTHNGTHLLIDSTDIGKYTAFSSIGSGIVYDRRSWITTFIKDNRQTQEKKNSTLYTYAGGFLLDSDIVYELNGTKLFFPEGDAGIGAVIIERDKAGNITKNPEAIFVYKGKQFRIPLRYAYDKKFIDFNSGLDFGVFIFPRLTNANQIDPEGAMLLLSNKTVKSALARLYLYKEDNPYYKLVHTEDSYIVSEIKKQFPDFNSDFVFYSDFNGPIRIWEINYPKDIKAKPEYLNTTYPDIRLTLS